MIDGEQAYVLVRKSAADDAEGRGLTFYAEGLTPGRLLLRTQPPFTACLIAFMPSLQT